MYAVETFELTKYYSNGKVKALQEFNLQVEQGKIFSLLGPNGAGKTTLIKLMIGIIHPTKGSAQLLGRPITDYTIHSRIGYLAENHRFPEFLTAAQLMYYYGKMSGLEKATLKDKIPQLLKTVNLQDWINVKVHKYSKGMMQRLGLAHALLNDPDLIFMDEPTDGIDPVGRREIRTLLKSLRDRGKTIFINSHLLSEVERMSDEVAILKDGKLLQKGSVEDFTSIKEQYQLRLQDNQTSINEICIKMDIPLSAHNGLYTIAVKDTVQLNRLIDELRKSETIIQAVMPRKISLEDFFIEVIEEKEEAEN